MEKGKEEQCLLNIFFPLPYASVLCVYLSHLKSLVKRSGSINELRVSKKVVRVCGRHGPQSFRLAVVELWALIAQARAPRTVTPHAVCSPGAAARPELCVPLAFVSHLGSVTKNAINR